MGWIMFGGVISPDGLMLFSKYGPFAWNALISFFLPLAAFALWIAAMVVLPLVATDRENGEPFGRVSIAS